MATQWKVDCWNCDEGFLSYWNEESCPICKGTGRLVVSELTDDNYDSAEPVDCTNTAAQ